MGRLKDVDRGRVMRRKIVGYRILIVLLNNIIDEGCEKILYEIKGSIEYSFRLCLYIL